MEPFTRPTGIVVPLDQANVDTDQVIPGRHLLRVERLGFGEFLFANWRFLEDGSPNPDFVLNKPEYQGATILVAGPNFGCGSSREHAPWALGQYGFRALIAPSFADIFRNNCFQNGMLPVVLPEERVREIMRRATDQPGYQATVDLEQLTVTDDQGFHATFQVDEFRRYSLLNGLDDIDLTLQHEDKIAAYERAHAG